jgi:hypothetical protein
MSRGQQTLSSAATVFSPRVSRRCRMHFCRINYEKVALPKPEQHPQERPRVHNPSARESGACDVTNGRILQVA